MSAVRTHTFRHGKYRVEFTKSGIFGCCDIPGDDDLRILILEGGSFNALKTAIHEAMHAEDVPEWMVEDDTPERIATFLWRMGWRRMKE